MFRRSRSAMRRRRRQNPEYPFNRSARRKNIPRFKVKMFGSGSTFYNLFTFNEPYIGDSISITVVSNKDSVDVEWGDGSSSKIYNGQTITHTY